ncbi:hypothetical protein BN1723_019958 [Verticillium longisporum]|uniref:Uncharacterized protein n=1 Tax=Verticillium longisporum TaxID=100787 RepID=A0A0G4NIN1_VERLO|nr:hypothetical protein BN1723_019958 [Verticillium longisporum]
MRPEPPDPRRPVPHPDRDPSQPRRPVHRPLRDVPLPSALYAQGALRHCD